MKDGLYKLILTMAVIIFGALWFILIIVNSQRSIDTKILMMDMKQQPKIDLKFISTINDVRLGDPKKRHFQFSQLSFTEKPNLLGNEGILIIITEEQVQESTIRHFLFQLKRQNSEFNYTSMPIYILKQSKPFYLQNEKSLRLIAQEIQQLFIFCVIAQSLTKYSIIAYQQGALLTLLSFSQALNVTVFQKISKMILINPFNPRINIFQSNPRSTVDSIKNTILNDKQILNGFQSLRLIIINTIRTFYIEHPEALHYFNFAFQDQGTGKYFQLKNTVAISTKNMWNIYINFQEKSYFKFQPFIWIITKFVIEDNTHKYSNSQIRYFFTYRETSASRDLSQNLKKRYLALCKEFHLENMEFEGVSFQEECVKLVKKQSFYYENATMIIFSDRKQFNVYGPNFDKIYPIESKVKNLVIYQIQNINEINKIYVISQLKLTISIRILPIHTPLYNPILPKGLQIDEQTDFIYLKNQNIDYFIVIRSCQPANLIFPIHYKRAIDNKSGTLIKIIQENNCYMEYDKQEYYPDWYIFNWNILRNLMVFTCFCSHVLDQLTFKRLFTQAFVNICLLALILNQLFIIQNVVIISIVALSQIILVYCAKMMESFTLLKNFNLIVMFMPLFCQFMSHFPLTQMIFDKSWKILSFQILILAQQKNIMISTMKYYFMIGMFSAKQSCQYGLFLLLIWQYFTIQKYVKMMNTKINRLKTKIADTAFLIVMAISLDQDGSVIHEILNFYIITHALLTLSQTANYYFGNR